MKLGLTIKTQHKANKAMAKMTVSIYKNDFFVCEQCSPKLGLKNIKSWHRYIVDAVIGPANSQL